MVARFGARPSTIDHRPSTFAFGSPFLRYRRLTTPKLPSSVVRPADLIFRVDDAAGGGAVARIAALAARSTRAPARSGRTGAAAADCVLLHSTGSRGRCVASPAHDVLHAARRRRRR